MNFNRLLKSFLPQDKVFYLLFEQVSRTVVEMATLLSEYVNHKDEEVRQELFKKINALEHFNDNTTHQIFVELGKNFVTPFDREDIHTLASTIDDIADYIQGTAKKMWLYKLFEVNETITSMSKIIYECSLELKDAIHELRTMSDIKKISNACITVNSLENKADDVYDSAVAALFENGDDSKRIIVLKDIFHALEAATDKCEDVANVLESIVLKYA